MAAVAELDRLRLETHRKNLAAEQAALADLNTQRTALAALQKDAARAKVAVDTAVSARNRMIDDLDRRRDLAAQYVAELQQAQRDLERTVASTDAASTVMALPIRPFRGDLPWPIRGEVTERFGRVPSGRFGTTIVRNGIEVAAKEGTTVASGARGHGRVCRAVHRFRHAGDRRSRPIRIHVIWAFIGGRGDRRDERQPWHALWARSASRRPVEPPSTSKCESTAARSIPYNGSGALNEDSRAGPRAGGVDGSQSPSPSSVAS